MEKVKFSILPKDTIVLVSEYSTIYTVEDVLNDLDYFKEKDIYTTIPRSASLDAGDIIDNAMENEADNMYEDWYERICEDVTPEDIEEMQVIFNRILARTPSQNISYVEDKLIEIDVE